MKRLIMVVALVVLAGNAWGAKAVVPAQGVAAVAAKEVKVLFFGNSDMDEGQV